MADSFKENRDQEPWVRADILPLLSLILSVLLVIITVLLALISYLQGRTLSIFFYVLLIVIFISLFLFWRIYYQRKNTVMIWFSHDTNTMVNIIENILQQHNFKYKKLRDKPHYNSKNPFISAEIFEISDYNLFIIIQNPHTIHSRMVLGPVSPSNEIHFKRLKKILGEVCYPRLI